MVPQPRGDAGRATVKVSYSVPSDPLLPKLSLLQVLLSGSESRGPDDDEVMICWRSGDVPPTGPSAVGHVRGCNSGLFFYPKIGFTLKEIAMRPVQLGAGVGLGVFQGLLGHASHAEAIEKGFDDLAREVDEWAAKVVADEKTRKILQDPRTFCVPFANVMEASTLAVGNDHYLVIVVEREEGPASYTLRHHHGPFEEQNRQSETETFLKAPEYLMQSRFLEEEHYLIRQIKATNVDFAAIATPIIESYKTKYGENWAGEVPKIQAEIDTEVNKQFWAKGFTSQQLMTAFLESLASLLPHFRQVPTLKREIALIEALARGQPEVWAIPNAVPQLFRQNA